MKAGKTKYCMSCRKYKPESEIKPRMITNVNNGKSSITRCDACWARRGR